MVSIYKSTGRYKTNTDIITVVRASNLSECVFISTVVCLFFEPCQFYPILLNNYEKPCNKNVHCN